MVRKILEMDYLWSVTHRRILKWYHTRDTQNLRNEVLTFFCIRYAKPMKWTMECYAKQNLRNGIKQEYAEPSKWSLEFLE